MAQYPVRWLRISGAALLAALLLSVSVLSMGCRRNVEPTEAMPVSAGALVEASGIKPDQVDRSASLCCQVDRTDP